MFRSQLADQFVIRFPGGMRDAIKRSAKSNRRSMNAEIIFHLEKVFEASAPTAATGDRLDAEAPAAAFHTTALQGGDIANPANEVP